MSKRDKKNSGIRRFRSALSKELNASQFLGNPTAFDHALWKFIAELARKPDLSKTALRLYVVLAERTNRKTGYCYPGVHTLANELTVSPQAVRKACRELECAGFIHVERNASNFRTNVYVLDFRMLQSNDSEDKNMVPFAEPATPVSGPLSKEIFGETTVSGLGSDEQELLDFASERKFSHG